MAQARRIKPKATKTKKSPAKKKRAPIRLPLGLVLVIIICTAVITTLVLGAREDGNGGLGAGLKELLKPEPPEDSDEAIVALIEDKDTDKVFSFYDMLKDDEQFMPDDLPEANPSRPKDDRIYYLQAASFRAEADAEKLRARLALKGFKSITQARAVKDNGVFYRVRLGPFPDKRKAKTVKNKLQRLGVRPYVYSDKK